MNALGINVNKDIHDGVCYHISKAHTFPEDNNQKFSIMTEKKGASAYLQLQGPSLQIENAEHDIPNSFRIIQDMEHIYTETYWQIFNACGVALEGRIGQQKKKGVGPGCSGKGMKKSVTERRWLHPDARGSASDGVSGSAGGGLV
eukprot:14768950-Ditylum_brightwellii.AAC.1